MPTDRRASRALRPAVDDGTVLAGRYRLRRRQPPRPADPDEAERWLALDEVLARPVDVVLLPAHGRRAAAGRRLLEAAAAAGTVAHPALTSVYDAALEAVPAERSGRSAGEVDVAYVVSEHVVGTPLTGVLAEDGPLEPDAALELGLAAAEGLAAAHARGVLHGALSPAVVLLDGDGAVRVADTAVAGALADRADDAEPATSPADDVRALAACVYAMLTGCWPERATAVPGAGLRPAPLTAGREGRLCSPRQVRAGVPRALDAAVLRVLEPPATGPRVETADALLRALRAAGDADAAAHAAVHRPRGLPSPPPQVQRVLAPALVALLLVVVGLVAFSKGRDLGTVTGSGTELEALVDSTPSPVPGGDGTGTGQRIDLAAPGVAVTAFDPAPGDGRENDAAVPNAVDGDAGTAWDTERYDTSRFGGLKQGVGLLVDLGQPTAVQQVELGLAPGADVELRVADERSDDPAAYAVVASVADAEPVARLVPGEPVTTRWVLVWFTRLPPDGERFRGSLRELFLVRP